MQSLGEILKNARKKTNTVLRKVSVEVDIDLSLISKFEKNERKPTKQQLVRLAHFYGLSEKDLLISWYAEKIADELKYVEAITEILKTAEEKIVYYKSKGNG
jgi:transcriptional regulator with XRE-family HTH domain